MGRGDDGNRGAKYRGSDIHGILQLVAFCIAAALAGCSIDSPTFTGIEDFEVAGGLEPCDDGNLVTETACPWRRAPPWRTARRPASTATRPATPSGTPARHTYIVSCDIVAVSVEPLIVALDRGEGLIAT